MSRNRFTDILRILRFVDHSTGKGTLESQNDSHATSVVKQLLQDYLGKGHILYIDNFYSSVSLAEYLLSEKTGMVGTLRANRRGTPKNLMNSKLKKEKPFGSGKEKLLLANGKIKEKLE
nr:unnamed protein product [Callosobruchus chinensis]